MPSYITRSLMLCSALSLVTACATPGLQLPPPLRAGKAVESGATPVPEDSAVPAGSHERFHDAPAVPPLRQVQATEQAQAPRPATGKPIDVNFENTPLPMIINEVYGNLLGKSFEIAPELQGKRDLVTLRISEPMPPAEVDTIVRRVLRNYGVAVEEQGEMLRFVPSRAGTGGEPPLLVSGRALPTVPESHRPVFQLVPLKVVRSNEVRNWLMQAFQGQAVEIHEDASRNAVLFKGRPDVVRQAIGALEVLDQPLMRGRHSLRIEPLYRSPDALAKELMDVLSAQGYAVANRAGSPSAVVIMPMTASGSVLVFATDPQVLPLVKKWTEQLDKTRVTGEEKGLFVYPAQHTSVEGLAEVVNQLMGTLAPPAADANDKKPAPALAAQGRVVVDRARNALIFQGTGSEWGRLLPVLKEMDQPTKLALIEVTIAEVTLNDDVGFGIEWALRNFGTDNFKGDLSTKTGVASGKGLTWLPITNSGNFRAVLNAYATSGRVNILSAPRLMVRNGGEASITVGTDVPIITSTATSAGANIGGDSALIQQVQYRETGTLLNIRPIIYSGGRIDLDVSQEVSKAEPNTLGGSTSPTILNRSINTSLTLADGESVLLGGLISTSRTRNASKVPLLGDVPVVGQLFRSDTDLNERTELMILITPYVISDATQAREITEAFRRQFSFEERPEASTDIEPTAP